MLWTDIRRLLVKNYIMIHIVQVIKIKSVTGNNLMKVYKFQNQPTQDGQYGKNFYSGSIEMYALLYHLVLFHMVKDLLESNLLQKKRFYIQLLHYGMFMRRLNVYLILMITLNFSQLVVVLRMDRLLKVYLLMKMIVLLLKMFRSVIIVICLILFKQMLHHISFHRN